MARRFRARCPPIHRAVTASHHGPAPWSSNRCALSGLGASSLRRVTHAFLEDASIASLHARTQADGVVVVQRWADPKGIIEMHCGSW
ncbi:Hypothetical protein A7982_03363 [Minicystis rosea]|nr:Hypothetical protein A7982_03363 [Minicystis rosea]